MIEKNTSGKFNGLIFIAAWLALWTCIQTWLLVQYGIPLRFAVIDAVVTQCCLMIDAYAEIMMVRFFRPTKKNSLYFLIAGAVLSLLFVNVLNTLLNFLIQDIRYLQMLKDTLLLRFVFLWLMMGFIGTAGWLWLYWKEQNEEKSQRQAAEKLLREAELSSLREQLQPHFLFNSLNSISSLVGTQPEQARKMVEQLSDFLRGTIKKESNQFVSLREELHHLQLYLDIEKIRFGHRLITNVEAEATAQEMKLPSLLLQPVLENAIKFGLYDNLGEVAIMMTARGDQNNLIVEIKNPFDPASALPKPGTGFGLSSIQRRLSLLFYRNDLLTTQQNENTFTTTIKIPQR